MEEDISWMLSWNKKTAHSYCRREIVARRESVGDTSSFESSGRNGRSTSDDDVPNAAVIEPGAGKFIGFVNSAFAARGVGGIVDDDVAAGGKAADDDQMAAGGGED